MASSYNTRSTGIASSVSAIKLEPLDPTQQSQGTGTSTAGVNAEPRHYCIAFTNNPRMLRRARPELSLVTGTNSPVG